MFTGIVLEEGEVVSAETSSDGSVLKIRCHEIMKDMGIGDSISVNGCCLTIFEFDETGFKVEATPETLRLTNLGSCVAGSRVNLEPAARLADFLGGHLVQGHVDDKGTVVSIRDEGNSKVFRFSASEKVLRYCTYKGSVTVNGVSLTVTASDSEGFEVAIIPHTLEVTNFSAFKLGDEVNLEADIISKYVESHVKRLMLTVLLTCFVSLGYLFGGDVHVGSNTILLYENKTAAKGMQFVVRVARYRPDLVVEWENEIDQGTAHVFSKAVAKAEDLTLSQLFEVGVDAESAEQMTVFLPDRLFAALKDKGKAKVKLNSVQAKLKLEGTGKHMLSLDGEQKELEVLLLSDTRRAVWAVLDNPEYPLIVKYKTQYFEQYLKSISTPDRASLRWIRKLPPVR